MRSARQRSFRSSPYLPGKEGRAVNIAAFSVACLACCSALSWVFCCTSMSLCSHWTLGLSNESVKDNSNYFLLSPVSSLRAKQTCFSQWHRAEKLLSGQSSWLCLHRGSPWTCQRMRCFCRAKTWKLCLFSTLLARDFTPQGIRDLHAIQCKIFASWKLNNLENFKTEKTAKQFSKMQTKVMW